MRRGCRFMAAWAREEEKTLENRRRKRETEGVDKVEVPLGVTVASLRRFRAVLIGRTQDSASGVGCADREALRVL